MDLAILVIYAFNNFTINTNNFQLLKNDEPVSVEPQVFNIILYLVENQDRVVSRDELLDNIWKGRIVSDASISNHIKFARKVLDDDGQKQAVIKTTHGRGYQFIATCKSVDGSEQEIEEELNTKNIRKSSTKFTKYLKLFVLLLVVLIGVWLINLKTARLDPSTNLEKSIAVLAFKDFSPKSDQAYFAEGISEELLNIFTKIPNLRVASRTSSFSFKNKSLTIEKIGKELNVNYVMEGSVRKAGNKLRITAQLIRVADGSHIWSETYEHTMDDIFKIQDNIATEVTKQLRIKLVNENVKVTHTELYPTIKTGA